MTTATSEHADIVLNGAADACRDIRATTAEVLTIGNV